MQKSTCSPPIELGVPALLAVFLMACQSTPHLKGDSQVVHFVYSTEMGAHYDSRTGEVATGYGHPYMEENRKECSSQLSASEAQMLRDAIEQSSVFESSTRSELGFCDISAPSHVQIEIYQGELKATLEADHCTPHTEHLNVWKAATEIAGEKLTVCQSSPGGP